MRIPKFFTASYHMAINVNCLSEYFNIKSSLNLCLLLSIHSFTSKIQSVIEVTKEGEASILHASYNQRW